MLKTPREIIRILMTLNDYYHIKSNYVIVGKKNAQDPSRREPFAPGFLSSIDCKKEVLKGLKEMDSRQRKILLLYYSFSKSTDDIKNILKQLQGKRLNKSSELKVYDISGIDSSY